MKVATLPQRGTDDRFWSSVSMGLQPAKAHEKLRSSCGAGWQPVGNPHAAASSTSGTLPAVVAAPDTRSGPALPFALTQLIQMLPQRLADQRGSIHLLALRRKVGRSQELRIQNYLYRLHCGSCSTV
jgi:hypothetical protein